MPEQEDYSESIYATHVSHYKSIYANNAFHDTHFNLFRWYTTVHASTNHLDMIRKLCHVYHI